MLDLCLLKIEHIVVEGDWVRIVQCSLGRQTAVPLRNIGLPLLVARDGIGDDIIVVGIGAFTNTTSAARRSSIRRVGGLSKRSKRVWNNGRTHNQTKDQETLPSFLSSPREKRPSRESLARNARREPLSGGT